MKILIIRLSSMGDVVLTTPLITKLREKFVNDEIDFLVSKEFSEVLINNPHLNNVIQYNKRASYLQQIKFKQDFKKNISKGKYDIIIDLQNNLRSRIFRRNLYKALYTFNKRRLFKYNLVKKKKLTAPPELIPELYCKAVSDLIDTVSIPPLQVWLPEEKVSCVYLSSKTSISGCVIAVAPGAKHFTKRLPPDKFISILNEIKSKTGCKLRFIGGPADADNILDVAAMIPDTEIKINNSIIETCRDLDSARLLITNDTGVMHLAAARQTPVVAIYGSTVPELGFTPYKVANEIAEVKGLHCRPCTHIGRSSCPEGHFKCMTMQNEVEIVNKSLELLNNI